MATQSEISCTFILIALVVYRRLYDRVDCVPHAVDVSGDGCIVGLGEVVGDVTVHLGNGAEAGAGPANPGRKIVGTSVIFFPGTVRVKDTV